MRGEDQLTEHLCSLLILDFLHPLLHPEGRQLLGGMASSAFLCIPAGFSIATDSIILHSMEEETPLTSSTAWIIPTSLEDFWGGLFVMFEATFVAVQTPLL